MVGRQVKPNSRRRLRELAGTHLVLREALLRHPRRDRRVLAPARRVHLVAAEVQEIVREEAGRRTLGAGLAARALFEQGGDEREGEEERREKEREKRGKLEEERIEGVAGRELLWFSDSHVPTVSTRRCGESE